MLPVPSLRQPDVIPVLKVRDSSQNLTGGITSEVAIDN